MRTLLRVGLKYTLNMHRPSLSTAAAAPRICNRKIKKEEEKSAAGETVQQTESAILARLLKLLPAAQPGLLLGPGDDCAVVARDAQWDSLLKTDVVVEGIHFTPDTDPRLIGRKALARVLSDIAAMGGIPEHALVTLLAHSSCPVQRLESVYAGLSDLATSYHVDIAGGELSSLPAPGLVVNVALTGKVEHGRAFLRGGGVPGDVLCVSGPLGGSFPSGRHLTFSPRTELGRTLQTVFPRPHAVMDISDGLASDLPRLAQASHCGYSVREDRLPLQPGCTPQQALCDGEDYELLLALPADGADALCAQFGLTRIGELTAGDSTPLGQGWQHFSSLPLA